MPALRYREQPAGTPARDHLFLRQHPESGPVSGRGAERVQPADGARAPNCGSCGAPRARKRSRSSRNCAPPASTWATKSWLPASRAPDGEKLGSGVPGRNQAPGFPEFLKKEVAGLTVETRGDVVAFGPRPDAVKALGRRAGRSRRRIPGHAVLYAHRRILPARAPACCWPPTSRASAQARPGNMRYFIAEQKEVNNQMETRAAVGFDGPRTGIAGMAGRSRPHGVARLRLARGHLRHGVRGEEPGGDRGRTAGNLPPLGSRRAGGAGHRAAADRYRCSQRSGCQSGRRVLALARRPAFPGAFVEAGDRGLRPVARAGDAAKGSGRLQPGGREEGREAAADRAGELSKAGRIT